MAVNAQRVFVAGHRGMVGSAIVRQLQADGRYLVVTAAREELDLRSQSAVQQWLARHRPDHVILAAAKVGGIHANRAFPVDFLYDNLIIEANVIHAAHAAGISRLLFLGSSCIYPRLADQPMREEALLTGPLEPTNEPYAIAKIAGIKLCEAYRLQHGVDYRSVMPTNLYGPGDNFHPMHSHVIPALLRRFHDATCSGAPEVTVWGSGVPRREFLHVDDLAKACVHVMALAKEQYALYTAPSRSFLNVGTGRDCSIAELVQLVARVTGFSGDIHFDASMPDGAPRKLLDVSRLTASGWQAQIGLEEGLRDTFRWFVANQASTRLA
ncbi:MAG: GDP-L-fucose synthase [Burkholderiaceae bacterium]